MILFNGNSALPFPDCVDPQPPAKTPPTLFRFGGLMLALFLLRYFRDRTWARRILEVIFRKCYRNEGQEIAPEAGNLSGEPAEHSSAAVLD